MCEGSFPQAGVSLGLFPSTCSPDLIEGIHCCTPISGRQVFSAFRWNATSVWSEKWLSGCAERTVPSVSHAKRTMQLMKACDSDPARCRQSVQCAVKLFSLSFYRWRAGTDRCPADSPGGCSMLTKDGVPQDNAGHPDLVNQNDGSTFDAGEFSRMLAEAGIPAEVAETMARLAQQDKAEQAQNLAALRVELRDELARRNNDRLEHLATKADVERVRRDLSDQIKDLKAEVNNQIKDLRAELSDQIKNGVAEMWLANEKLQRTLLWKLLGIAATLGGGLLAIMAKTHGWAGF